MKEREKSRMTSRFLGMDDGVMIVPSAEMNKIGRGDALEQR